MSNTAKTQSTAFVPASTTKVGRGATHNATARRNLAASLFSNGLTFLGVLGRDMAKVLIENGSVTMPNGSEVSGPQKCPFCGSYNGKQKTDYTRLALTAVFYSGAKDPKDKSAVYHFVSAGSSESCLATYIEPSKVGHGEALKKAYGAIW